MRRLDNGGRVVEGDNALGLALVVAGVVLVLTFLAVELLGGCGAHLTMTGAGPALVVPIHDAPAWRGDDGGRR